MTQFVFLFYFSLFIFLFFIFFFCKSDVPLFVSFALAGKRSLCPLLPVVVCHEKRVNIWLYLPHDLVDFNQSWVIGATWKPSYTWFIDKIWKPSYVHAVKDHKSKSKVI